MAAYTRYNTVIFVLTFWKTLLLKTTIASINIEELNSIIYHVDILNNPVLSEQEPIGLVMHLTSKYGQEYQCSLPDIPNAQDEQKLNGHFSSATVSTDIVQLLKPLETAPCLMKTKDWWTYEFCYGMHIKQYHLEDNKIASPVIVLGLYESDYNWENESQPDENNRSRRQRYHSQLYVNGSVCDVTGAQRRSEVRFICEEGSGDYISHVDEPVSCQYVVSIHTSKVCRHPYLRPLPSNKPQNIICNPVLNSEQYQSFLKREEEEKKAVEEKRKAWLAKQEEQLIALKQQKEEQLMKDSAGQASHDSEKLSADLQGTEKYILDDASSTLGQDVEEIEENNDHGIKKSEATKSKHDNESNDIDWTNTEKDEDAQKESLVSGIQKLTEKWEAVKDDTFNKILKLEEKIKHYKEKDNKNSVEYDGLAKLISNLKERIEKQKIQVQKWHNVLQLLQKGRGDKVVTQKIKAELEPEADEMHGQEGVQEDLETALKNKLKKLKRFLQRDSDSTDETQNTEDTEISSIQQELIDKLKQSGFDAQGRKFEVKIVTAGYFDDNDEFHTIDDDSQVHTVVIKLMTGDDEAAEHMQHQQRLEKNYRFVWNDDDSVKDSEDESRKSEK